MCKNWPSFPIGVTGATGGVIGKTVVICGGHKADWSVSDECYSLTFNKRTFVTNMSVRRRYAASIVLNNNTLWVTGGSTGGSTGGPLSVGYLASTEKVRLEGTVPGPDLPMAIYLHTIVAINSTVSMLIGGYDGSNSTLSTFYHNHVEGEWINGPNLMQIRSEHAAGIVTDEMTEENFVALTGGSHGSGYSNSTEILQDGTWVQGKISDSTIY